MNQFPLHRIEGPADPNMDRSIFDLIPEKLPKPRGPYKQGNQNADYLNRRDRF
jgi:hypothetical protein